MMLTPQLVKKFKDIYSKAQKCGLKEPTAVTLSTCSSQAKPSIRTVLLKSFDENGFIFFTNKESRKGSQLKENPYAAMCFYWQPLEKQVIVEGVVKEISSQESDEYFQSRPINSQIGAWASKQSRSLQSRSQFVSEILKLKMKFLGKPIPRPDYWGGFCLKPIRMEFWTMKPFRLHERKLYEFSKGDWKELLLYP
ncbi:MAG: pyridoxamine 5'-phosphate oxidase [Elusimicrobiota bacterium]